MKVKKVTWNRIPGLSYKAGLTVVHNLHDGFAYSLWDIKESRWVMMTSNKHSIMVEVAERLGLPYPYGG